MIYAAAEGDLIAEVGCQPAGFHACGQCLNGMNGIHAVEFRSLDDLIDIEIGFQGLVVAPHLVSLIRFEAVRGEAVLVGENTDGSYSQFGRGAQHADGNFSPISNENLFDFQQFRLTKTC